MAAFEWNILRFSVCEACGLGPDDRFMHVCGGRLATVRRARLPAMDLDRLPVAKRLRKLSARRLRALGRLTAPLLVRGEDEPRRIPWDDALKLAAHRLADGARVDGARDLSLEATWALQQLGDRFPEADPALLVLGEAPDRAHNAPQFRVHVLEALDPFAVTPIDGEVLLLPAQSRYSQSGGSTWRGPDEVVRFSPEIRGNPVPGARPDWAILCGILGFLGVDPPPAVRAVRHAIEGARPHLAGLAALEAPGDRLHAATAAGQS